MPEILALPGTAADSEPDYTMFENKAGLAEDLKFLASMPELCDVTFLVGDTREPVCAVKVQKHKSSFVFFTNKPCFPYLRQFWPRDHECFKNYCTTHHHRKGKKIHRPEKISCGYF
jgi:hypothetical protein